MSAQTFHNHEDREQIPRVLLRAIGVMLLLITAMVARARFTGMPPAASPPPDSEIVESRTIYLFGDISGAAKVLDAQGQMIADFGPGKGGFIAGVSRSLDLVRRQAGVDQAAPVRLVRFPDGHLGLRDDLTGWRAELMGFGKDNEAAFAKLLSKQ